MPSTCQDQKERIRKCVFTLLKTGKVKSQEELCEKLHKQGIEISQSRISRLIHKFGAMKTPDGNGGLVYVLPEFQPPPQANSPITELVTGIESNETSIVIYTNSGSAALIARLIEFHDYQRDIIGLIAGTDTVLVIPKSVKTLDTTLKTVCNILKWQREN